MYIDVTSVCVYMCVNTLLVCVFMLLAPVCVHVCIYILLVCVCRCVLTCMYIHVCLLCQIFQCVFAHTYVTVPEKRVLVAQIMIFRYRRFSATTPKNNSRDKTFVFVSEVSPTLCLHSR